jgi:hypothetical protein
MKRDAKKSKFKAKLIRPASSRSENAWAFLVLPQSVSDTLPRRGRTSVEGTLDGQPFQATLEPDGQLSHWLKVDRKLLEASDVVIGDTVTLELAPISKELEPALPPAFRKALTASPKAKETWSSTTTVARVDWIHWLESAKQAKTRQSRIDSACEMLASGKKRVCCFDPSGFYSKSLSAPGEAK